MSDPLMDEAVRRGLVQAPQTAAPQNDPLMAEALKRGLVPQTSQVVQPAAPDKPIQSMSPDGRQVLSYPKVDFQKENTDLANLADAASAGAVDMATFNQGNKLDAYLQSKTGIGGTKGDYEGNLKTVQANRDAAKTALPGGYVLGGAFGGFANPATRALGAVSDAAIPLTQAGKLGTLMRYGNRIVQGGANGAAYGAGFARPGEGARDAAIGALGGSAIGAGAQLAGDVVAMGQGLLKSPSALQGGAAADQAEQQLRSQMNEKYAASEQAGAVVKPEAFQEFVDGLQTKLKGYRARLAPDTTALLDEFRADAAAATPKTLADLDELRQVASETAKGAKPNDLRLIGAIKDHLDDFMEGLHPGQLLAGDADTAVAALNDARTTARSYYKMRDINDIAEIGQNLNDANWVKNQFRTIVRKKLGQYTPDEQDIIKEIARTGNLEKLARMTPWRGLQTAAPVIAQVNQGMKLTDLQDLIAKGGSRAAPAGANRGQIFGLRPPYAFGAFMANRALSPDRANGQ